MAFVTSAIVPIRSMIAALIARYSPKHYKQIIERRHPGVLVIGDATSDVRTLKQRSFDEAVKALEAVELPLIASIDDRHCWIILAGSGDDPHSAERLVEQLLDRGMRTTVTLNGRHRRRVASRHDLAQLQRQGPMKITAIKAGFIWMRKRGTRQIGWHAATRIHLYDWDGDKNTYRARYPGSLPPMIDMKERSSPEVVGLTSHTTRLDKIRFPIDVVYTWVNGGDPQWNAKRQARAAEVGCQLHRVANSDTRYMNRDELRYSLRSLYYYAPWVRRIYLVTDNQIPSWYDAASGLLTIVTHEELFPDPSSLPTFNSHAIESVLHRIPGLSEHFLYMNDDVFFSSIVHPETFFEVSGIARTFLSRSMIPFCEKSQSEIASEWGAINANQLLQEAHGAVMPYKTKHTPIPLRRTLLQSLEDRFPVHFAELRKRPFRTTDDLAPTSSLHAYFGMAEGLVVRGDVNYRYLNLSRPDLKRALQDIAYSKDAMVYCLNDTEVDEHVGFDWIRQERIVTAFLRMMYPYQAPWEKPEALY